MNLRSCSSKLKTFRYILLRTTLMFCWGTCLHFSPFLVLCQESAVTEHPVKICEQVISSSGTDAFHTSSAFTVRCKLSEGVILPLLCWLVLTGLLCARLSSVYSGLSSFQDGTLPEWVAVAAWVLAAPRNHLAGHARVWRRPLPSALWSPAQYPFCFNLGCHSMCLWKVSYLVLFGVS